MGGAYTKNPSAVDLNTPAKSKLIFSLAIVRKTVDFRIDIEA
jgi:hypothetical protein